MNTALALQYARNNQQRFIDELDEFVRFPSISAQAKYREALNDCARWLAAHLQSIGFNEARIIPTRGHPLVYAERIQSRSLPTVLIYGHYDVQPPDDKLHSPNERFYLPNFFKEIDAGIRFFDEIAKTGFFNYGFAPDNLRGAAEIRIA